MDKYEKVSRDYQMEIREDTLILRTGSFRAEKGSFLHGMIFNRELASSLSAGAVLMLLALLLGVNTRITAVHFIMGAALFAGLFLIFRIYLFRERILETVIDEGRCVVTFRLKGMTGSRERSYPIGQLRDVNLRRITLQPENVDGIRVVEKIALQHGTVLPGFGKTTEIATVSLSFTGGKEMTVFSSRDVSEAKDIVSKIRGFLAETVCFDRDVKDRNAEED